MRKQSTYVEKIRTGQDRVHSTHSACKSRDREYVTQDQLRRTKEGGNRAIREYTLKFGEAVRRDHVLGESLLATQFGKDKRLICRKDVHDTLKAFVETVKNDLEMPELLLPL